MVPMVEEMKREVDRRRSEFVLIENIVFFTLMVFQNKTWSMLFLRDDIEDKCIRKFQPLNWWICLLGGGGKGELYHFGCIIL